MSQLTCNSHPKASDIRIGAKPKRTVVVWLGGKTIGGQVRLVIFPGEVQVVHHVVCDGTVVHGEVGRVPKRPIGEAGNVWRVSGRQELVRRHVEAR
jgi:hypothetical protein